MTNIGAFPVRRQKMHRGRELRRWLGVSIAVATREAGAPAFAVDWHPEWRVH
jgi:hypothetical protein